MLTVRGRITWLATSTRIRGGRHHIGLSYPVTRGRRVVSRATRYYTTFSRSRRENEDNLSTVYDRRKPLPLDCEMYIY